MGLKQKIKNKLLEKAKEQLTLAAQAAESAKNLSREGDLKSDGKYDTRGVEAGYLAGAQAKRVEEIKQDIALLESIELDHDSKTVSIGSLIELEYNKNTRVYFLSSTSGGNLLNIDGQAILVISVFSPIGQAVVNLSLGDEFEVLTKEEARIYQIKKIS